MRLLLFFAACIVTSGCGDFNSFYEARKAGVRPGPGNPEVIALVGEEEITKGDLYAALARLPHKQRKLYESSPERMAEYLETVINQRVLHSEAVKRGIDRREDILERTENLKRQLVGQALAQEILGSISVGENDARDYYEKNSKDFERVKVRKLVIKPDPANDTDKARAAREAESVSERARAGEPWETLPGQAGDGRPEHIERGQLPGPVEEEIFSMKKGEISGPLEVGNEYFIIKIEEEPAPVPFGEVSRKIESDITNGKVVEYIYSLREKWDVVVYKERLQERAESE